MSRLGLMKYLAYLEGTNTSRSVCEGEEILNAGHIILCGKLNTSTQEKIRLHALCLQTSSLNSDPHHIEGELFIGKEKNNVEIVTMMCSCKAGSSGRCKHISAVLLKCTRENIDDFEAISQTDLKCIWSTQKHATSEKYKAVPIKEMPCFLNKMEESQLVFDQNNMLNFFINQLPDSAISKHCIGRRNYDMSDISESQEMDLENIYQTILDNACQSTLMLETSSVEVNTQSQCCKILFSEIFDEVPDTIIRISQRSKDWHEQRKYRVTGSRIYELYSYSKSEWENKAMRYFYAKGFTNKFVKHGIKHEGDAKDMFIEQTSLNVTDCGMIVSHSNPWLGYSPDGIIFEHNKPVALLEIKCLYEGANRNISEALPECKYLEKKQGDYVLKSKHKYYGQIQLGMAVLNLPVCYFVLYASFDKSMKIIKVESDYAFTKKMLREVKKKFFQKMLHVICTNK